MKVSLWLDSQAEWRDILAVGRWAASAGWHGLWVADHFMPAQPTSRAATHECFSLLSALAGLVPDVQLGSLVAGNTYRSPSLLAKSAVTIDHVSAGRFILGVGAGWQENEHRAFGFRFPSVTERLDRLEECCAIVQPLLTGERLTFSGRFHQVENAVLDPPPVRGRLPLLVGGGGERRTMRIAARYADAWNAWATPNVFRRKVAVLEEHCASVGRNAQDVWRSTQAILMMTRRGRRLYQEIAFLAGRPALIGDPEEVVDQVAAYGEAGADELIIPEWNLGSSSERIATLDFLREQLDPMWDATT